MATAHHDSAYSATEGCRTWWLNSPLTRACDKLLKLLLALNADLFEEKSHVLNQRRSQDKVGLVFGERLNNTSDNLSPKTASGFGWATTPKVVVCHVPNALCEELSVVHRCRVLWEVAGQPRNGALVAHFNRNLKQLARRRSAWLKRVLKCQFGDLIQFVVEDC